MEQGELQTIPPVSSSTQASAPHVANEPTPYLGSEPQSIRPTLSLANGAMQLAHNHASGAPAIPGWQGPNGQMTRKSKFFLSNSILMSSFGNYTEHNNGKKNVCKSRLTKARC
jgi:hypothetical protein